MDWPLLSVIIACKNRPDDLRRVIHDVRRQGYHPLEIVVVDDGSTPPLPELGADVQVRHDESRGVSVARNTAIERSRGEFLVNLDDDVTLPADDFLRRAVEIAMSHPGAAFVGFRQRRPDGSLHFQQPAQCDQLCRSSKFFGYGFMVRRSAIDRIGPFFGLMLLGGEEIELSLRALDAGYEILYAPSLEVIHHESSIGRDWRRMRRLTLSAQFFTTILRHPWWFILPSLVVQSARFVSMTARTNGVEWSALGYATRETLRNLSVLRRERRPVRFRTLLRNRQLNRNPEAVGGGVSESNQPFDASAPKQRF